MTHLPPPPRRIAYLPQVVAHRYLTGDVLSGRSEIQYRVIDEACESADGHERWDAEPLRRLLDEAQVRFAERPTQADAWLAPRLHSVLRVTRREATDERIWSFLSMRLGPDYVRWRHMSHAKDPEKRRVNPARFIGPFHKQAFARLWWAAELFRDGADYRPVEIACREQECFNQALRLQVICHRPTAQALIRLIRDEVLRNGDEIVALCKAITTAEATLLFESIAPDDPVDHDAYRDWRDEVGSTHVPYDRLPEGPDDGKVSVSSVDRLSELFEDLFTRAPIRIRNAEPEGVSG